MRQRTTGGEHAAFIPAVVNAFEHLDIAVTLWKKEEWIEIHERPFAENVGGFEFKHGAEGERFAYNKRCLGEARRKRVSVLGHHAGFSDLFVPIPGRTPVESVLVSGAFSTARPTSAEILERWRALTGRQGHPADPEFAEYLAITLSTLVLEGPHLGQYRRLLECLALLMASEGSGEALFTEIESLRTALAETRIADRMWRAARGMVNERSSRTWASPHMTSRLWPLGITQCPTHAVVALFASRQEGTDPVDDLLRRDTFQRGCVDIARRAAAISGQVGDRGITFLASNAGRGNATRTARRLMDLADEASSVARRRFGLRLHLGIGAATSSLYAQYQEALAAADSALAQGLRVVTLADRSAGVSPLGRLRRDLAARIEEGPDARKARFERYIEAIAAHCGHRLESTRLHLDAGFERIVEGARTVGAIDGPLVDRLEAAVERSASEATTVSDLVAVYRRAVADLCEASEEPTSVPREWRLRRAEQYMGQHYAESASLARVARVAGFAPSYFSKLFRQKHGHTFEQHLINLRIDRGKQLLSGTDLNLQRVAQLCGFSTRHHFGMMFRRMAGETPGRYRARHKGTFGPKGGAVDTRRRREGAAGR